MPDLTASSELAPVARSAIRVPGDERVSTGWSVSTRRSAAALQLRDESWLAKVGARGPVDGALQSALGVAFRTSSRRDGVLVVGSGPGEWLLVGRPGTAAQLLQQVGDQGGGEFVSAVDLTHGRALMRLTGAEAKSLLAKVCAVNLSDAVTPAGAAFRTSVAKVSTDIIRDDAGAGGQLSYLLHCERSSGQYLFDCLLDAGKEFGIEPAGSDLDGKDA